MGNKGKDCGDCTHGQGEEGQCQGFGTIYSKVKNAEFERGEHGFFLQVSKGFPYVSMVAGYTCRGKSKVGFGVALLRVCRIHRGWVPGKGTDNDCSPAGFRDPS